MFKKKKVHTLCATTLAGISALGSFAPMVGLPMLLKMVIGCYL
ncbi:hypothetical protein ACN9TI_00115 [Lactococcus lactis]